MLAEIITIGDELLIGQVVDTNSAWLGQQLSWLGIQVKQITSVSDDAAHIVEALDAAKNRAEIILITGGLGPTKDDITKKTLCEYFGMKWRTDEIILNDVISIFKKFGRETTDINKLQAQVPDGCIALRNKNGTAPGMWFDIDSRQGDLVGRGKVFISMPGVPYEMKGIFSDVVIPMLQNKFSLPIILHRTILTQGIGESVLAEKIEEWENSLAAEQIKLAYLPASSMVRLRLSATGENQEEVFNRINKKVEEVLPIISGYVFGFDENSLEKIVGEILKNKNQTLATAESCTGGLIANMITSVAGSSDYFKGAIVAYSNEIKTNELAIPEKMIAHAGVVSEEVAKQMAMNIRQKFKTDFSIAVTGIAGPTGGTEEKPVGTVWIAVANSERCFAKKFQFGDNRERNILRSAITALAMLRKFMLGELE